VTRRALRSAALAIIVTAAAPHALAQTSVEVSPLRVELQALPGSSTTQAVTLTNMGETPVRVKGVLADWYLSRDGSPQFLEPQEGRAFSAAQWVRFAPPEFVLEPHKPSTVRFTVSVPSPLDAASYRTGILFDFTAMEGNAAATKKQVLFKSRIATLIYVNVGQPPPAIELTDLRVQRGAEQTHVVATLKNTSRRGVRTKGSVIVYDAGGNVVREAPVPDVPVLPESERDVAMAALEASTRLPPGSYRVEVKIDVGLPALIVGETTLTVVQ
jgi:P pilus assembly chaperone PapD